MPNYQNITIARMAVALKTGEPFVEELKNKKGRYERDAATGRMVHVPSTDKRPVRVTPTASAASVRLEHGRVYETYSGIEVMRVLQKGKRVFALIHPLHTMFRDEAVQACEEDVTPYATLLPDSTDDLRYETATRAFQLSLPLVPTYPYLIARLNRLVRGCAAYAGFMGLDWQPLYYSVSREDLDEISRRVVQGKIEQKNYRYKDNCYYGPIETPCWDIGTRTKKKGGRK